MKKKAVRHLFNKPEGKPTLALLVDPDDANEKYFKNLRAHFSALRPDMFFVGGSVTEKTAFEQIISELKQLFPLVPVIIFPGNHYQVSAQADAILILSLVSGRNPDYLIGQQVAAAPFIADANIETFPTAYLMIDGGKITSGNYITQSMPIPADKPDIASVTALAAKQLGMQYVYLEAGSGAQNPVSAEMIRSVKEKAHLPIIVGGGIRNAEAAYSAAKAGANVIVIGTFFEKDPIGAVEIRLALDGSTQTTKVNQS